MTLMESINLPMGSEVIPFKLKGIDNKMYHVDMFTKAKGIVIVFTCNHCPYAQAVEPYLIELANEYQEKEILFFAINSNDSTNYPDDSFIMMQQRAKEKNYPFPYLHDETQATALAYQAQCTPDVYVYDRNNFLAYHGRVNNVRTAGDKAETHELQDALDKILQGLPPNKEQKSSMGCSIKWK